MPRVPLEQLKKQKRDGLPQKNVEEPTSLFAALRQKIGKAVHRKENQVKMPQRLTEKIDEDDIESAEQQETELDDILPAAAAGGPMDDDDKHLENDEPAEDRKMMKGNVKQPIQINDAEMEAMLKMEMRLQNVNRGRKLRVVVVENESENENEAFKDDVIDDAVNNHLELAGNADIFPTCQQVAFVVQADVHKGNSCQTLEDDNKRIVDEGKSAIPEMGDFGGARPKKEMNLDVDVDEVEDAREKSYSKHREKNKGKKNKQVEKERKFELKLKPEKPSKVEWGLEESSESDGGWDCDDIPLLPR